jgi:hypothetical protein
MSEERSDEVPKIPHAGAPRQLSQALNPDHAWKVLSATTDWIKHSETKAAATLTASGVAAGVLYNLVKDQRAVGWQLLASAIVCGSLALGGAFLAAWALKPRIWIKNVANSLIYFDHIARGFKVADGTREYTESLIRLIVDENGLVVEIAHQIWSNSQVAKKKFHWANLAVSLFLLCLPFLALTAILVATL